jgi:nucleoside-diphosphate-sugar epimerase
MHAIVTGAAGFIGSALTHRLLEHGDRVTGIDSFLDSYPREIKLDRLRDLDSQENFTFIEKNLVEMDLNDLLKDVDCVFHLAAQAGVRTSWGKRFEVYTESNILATQKLLEAAKNSPVWRFVYSSSSSIYGNAEKMPTPEEATPNPVSPYAVSKLAGEQLCHLYNQNFGVPTVILRYFTVYGPKPRPDQAVCIFTRALFEEEEIRVMGDGEQRRGMAYVDDAVRANILATNKNCEGEVINIGGGSSLTVNQLISHLERITSKEGKVRLIEAVKGDARHTFADISKARRLLYWEPEVDIVEGLKRTVASIKEYYDLK